MKKIRALGLSALLLLGCGRETFFNSCIDSHVVKVNATKDGRNVHVKYYGLWLPAYGYKMFGDEKDFYTRFYDNPFRELDKKVSEDDFILDEFDSDNGLFSWEIQYKRKNPRDISVINLTKWEVRYLLNQVKDEIRREHIDP